MELLEIEAYNDTTNKVVCKLRKLYVEVNPQRLSQVVVIFDEVHTGAAGNYTVQITMIADNTTQVPVYRQLADGTLEPVLIDSTDPNSAQKTIGEFDMWKILVFENNLISLNNAFTQGVRRKKGLTNEPLAFIDPFA